MSVNEGVYNGFYYGNFPMDLYYEVFTLVPKSKYAVLARVCKLFYSILKNDDKIWKRIALNEQMIIPNQLTNSWLRYIQLNHFYKNKLTKILSLSPSWISFHNKNLLFIKDMSAATHTPPSIASPHLGYITSITYCQDDKKGQNQFKIFTASTDSTICVWNFDQPNDEFTPIFSIFNGDGAVTALECHKNTLFCGTENGKISIWNVTDLPAFVCSIYGNSSHITCLALAYGHHNNALLFSGSTDGTVNVWIMENSNRELWDSLKGHKAAITALSYDEHHSNLFVAASDHTISIWDIDRYRHFIKIQSLQMPTPEQNPTTLLKIRFLGFLLSGSSNGEIHVWKKSSISKQWEKYDTLKGSGSPITCIKFCQNQTQKIITITLDHLIKTWPTPVPEGAWRDSFRRATEIHPILENNL